MTELFAYLLIIYSYYYIVTIYAETNTTRPNGRRGGGGRQRRRSSIAVALEKITLKLKSALGGGSEDRLAAPEANAGGASAGGCLFFSSPLAVTLSSHSRAFASVADASGRGTERGVGGRGGGERGKRGERTQCHQHKYHGKLSVCFYDCAGTGLKLRMRLYSRSPDCVIEPPLRSQSTAAPPNTRPATTPVWMLP